MRHHEGYGSLGGGGGGHHHHHHGRQFHGLPFPVMYPQYQEPSTIIVNNTSCPPVNDPVVGSDGRVYPNACEANAAGARVVRHLPPRALHGIADFLGPNTSIVLFGVALAAFLMLKKRG